MEKEEENDKVLLELKQKEDQFFSLQDQQQKHDRDGSSRIANLNQALMQTKQICAQLTEENEAMRQREMKLVKTVEDLEQEKVTLAKNQRTVCKDCLERETKPQYLCTPTRNASRPTPVTPIKPFPEETEVDSLHIENNKLKQELQCLQTNFQLTSQKSMQMKKEAKENEEALIELQSQFERTLAEKDDLKQRNDELKAALTNTTGSQLRGKERVVELENEVTTLRKQIDDFQQQNAKLQEKLKVELKQSLESQDVVERLDLHIKNMKDQNSSLEDELSNARETIQELECKLSSLQQTSNEQSVLQQKISAVKELYEHKLAILSTEKKDLENQLEEMQSDLDTSRDQVNLLEESRRDLQINLAALEAKNAVLLAKDREQSSLPDEVLKLQNTLEQLSEQYKEAHSQNKQYESDQQRSRFQIEELKKTNSGLQQEVRNNQELVEKLQKELEKHQASSHEVQTELQDRQKHCTKMASKVEELQLELASTNNAKSMYEMEVSKMMNRLEELEQTNFELTVKLSETETHGSSAQYALSETQTRLLNVEKRLREAESTLLEKEAVLNELNSTSELMENENTTLLSQVTSLSEMVAARNTKIEALQAHLSKYESESQEIVQMITELEEVHGQCGEMKSALQSEVDSLQQSLELALAEKKEAEDTIISQKLEFKELKVYNSSLESINADLQVKIQSQIIKCEEISCEQESAERREYDLKQELKMKSASLKSTLEEAEFAKKSYKDSEMALKAEVESFEAKCEKLREECENLHQEKKKMKATVMALQNEVGEQKQTLSTLNREKEALSDKFEINHSTLVAMKDELAAVQSKLTNSEAAQRHTEKQLDASKREVESVKEEMSTICRQYEKMRDSALSLLDPDSSSDGDDENAAVRKTGSKRRQLKGILKNSSSVLKPMENLLD